MAQRPLPQTSVKLQALQRDFQQISSMAGFLNSALDFPQLRLFFTLYGRILVPTEADGLAATPRLQAWAERIGTSLREDSSSAIMPPQVNLALPQALPRLIESLRFSIGPAWVFLISAEAIASDVGLGYRIFLVRRYLAMDVILPYVAWITLLAFLSDYLLKALQGRLYPWFAGARAT